MLPDCARPKPWAKEPKCSLADGTNLAPGMPVSCDPRSNSLQNKAGGSVHILRCRMGTAVQKQGFCLHSRHSLIQHFVVIRAVPVDRLISNAALDMPPGMVAMLQAEKATVVAEVRLFVTLVSVVPTSRAYMQSVSAKAMAISARRYHVSASYPGSLLSQVCASLCAKLPHHK